MKMEMKKINRIYTTILVIQASITLCSLAVASLGGVINHPYLAYFWYLGLIGIALTITTSLVVGTILALSQLLLRHSSRNGQKENQAWISRPKSARA